MTATRHGWMADKQPERPVEHSEGCLVAATIGGEITFPRPRNALVVCSVKHCEARSDIVGEMPCHRVLTS